MILDALVNQFVQRFQHEKRAQVCLWFDERRNSRVCCRPCARTWK